MAKSQQAPVETPPEPAADGAGTPQETGGGPPPVDLAALQDGYKQMRQTVNNWRNETAQMVTQAVQQALQQNAPQPPGFGWQGQGAPQPLMLSPSMMPGMGDMEPSQAQAIEAIIQQRLNQIFGGQENQMYLRMLPQMYDSALGQQRFDAVNRANESQFADEPIPQEFIRQHRDDAAMRMAQMNVAPDSDIAYQVLHGMWANERLRQTQESASARAGQVAADNDAAAPTQQGPAGAVGTPPPPAGVPQQMAKTPQATQAQEFVDELLTAGATPPEGEEQ